MAETMHLMTIGMDAWCGVSGSRRASSRWRDVTCPECAAKGMTWLRALVWDMLQAMPPGAGALGFAVRAGRLGVTDEQGRPLAMACAPDLPASPAPSRCTWWSDPSDDFYGMCIKEAWHDREGHDDERVHENKYGIRWSGQRWEPASGSPDGDGDSRDGG